jgi:hypothetical protein
MYHSTQLRFSAKSILTFLVILLSWPCAVHSAQITLAWEKPNDARVTGYKIFAGKAGTDFKATPNTTIYSADQTSCSISNLEEGQLYSFCAKSFDANGLESDFSETVNHLVISANDIDDDGDGYTENQGDCNDSDATIHPGALEICGDGIDQDCSGSDSQCLPDPMDVDNDGDGFSENQGDCNDNNLTIHPGAIETCGDGIDQDCNGSDLQCLPDPLNIDDDGDGFSENQGDCDDNNDTVHPGAIEICGDGIDQDCNGSDLICDPNSTTQTVVFGDTPNANYPGTVQDTFINLNQDVNFNNVQLNTYTWPINKPANAILLRFDLSQIPAGAQIQNATLSLYQTAAGGDAVYDVSVHKIINHNPDLNQATGYTCDGANQWTANNTCYNNIPLAQADIAAAENVKPLDQNIGYKEWVIKAMVQAWVNDSASNYGLLLNSDKVANSDSYRFFGASEATDAARRPKLTVTYTINFSPDDIDDDEDGYTENQGDCNDSNAAIHPGATEICGDGIDQDCNGSDLQCPQTWYKDSDGDSYSNGSTIQSVNRPASNYYLESELTANSGDCNDSNASVYPGAAEICGDGIDNNCNGSIDDGCAPDPKDVDDDGDGFTETDGDCNDNNATIYPGAIEICGDGIDQDCNGGDLACELDPEFVIQKGEVSVGQDWKFVPLTKPFVNPVVVAEPMSVKDSTPAVIRIRYVNNIGFEMRVQEWDYLDGKHTTETVGYIVVEAGHHVLPDGTMVEAGTFEASQYKRVSFKEPFNKIPVVVASVMSVNDTHAVTDRVYNISTGWFDCKLQEQKSSTRVHSTEAVSYLAWEPSKGSIDGMTYEVNKTSKIVTNYLYTIYFKQPFTSSPVFIADMQTMYESDTANLRWKYKYSNKVTLNISEEKSKTSIISHKAEVVGYMAIK